MTTLQAYMRVLPSHFIWQRERCESHRGKQLTINQLQTTHRNEAEWILYRGGSNWQKYQCTLDDCKTKSSSFTRGFKPFLDSKKNGKRKGSSDNNPSGSDNILKNDNYYGDHEKDEKTID